MNPFLTYWPLRVSSTQISSVGSTHSAAPYSSNSRCFSLWSPQKFRSQAYDRTLRRLEHSDTQATPPCWSRPYRVFGRSSWGLATCDLCRSCACPRRTCKSAGKWFHPPWTLIWSSHAWWPLVRHLVDCHCPQWLTASKLGAPVRVPHTRVS